MRSISGISGSIIFIFLLVSALLLNPIWAGAEQETESSGAFRSEQVGGVSCHKAFYHAENLSRAFRRYFELEGKIPTSVDEIAEKGYTFFKHAATVEDEKIPGWLVKSVSLTYEGQGKFAIWLVYPYPDGSGNFNYRALFLAERGSKSYEDMMNGLKNSSLMLIRHHPEVFGDIPQEKVYSGEFLIDNGREFRIFAKDEKEYAQIRWAIDLAYLLDEFTREFHRLNHRFPGNFRELEEFIGEKNERGWIAPLTGKPVTLQAYFNGENPAYRVMELNGKQDYEILIPLFGAGSQDVESAYQRFLRFQQGYFVPGKYVRIASF